MSSRGILNSAFSKAVLGLLTGLTVIGCDPNRLGNVVFEVDKELAEETVEVGRSLILIEDGKKAINKSQLRIKLASQYAIEVKISEGENCQEQGEWQKLSEQLLWDLQARNQEVTLSAKFRTSAGIESPCVSDSIIHDDVEPTLALTQVPSVFEKSNAASITYILQDSGSGIESVQCQWDGGNFELCSTNPVVRENLKEGNHSLVVRAQDSAGNEVLRGTEWTIDNTAPVIKLKTGPKDFVNTDLVKFHLEVVENGSGLDSLVCSLDDPAAMETCPLEKVFASLSEGNHIFYAQATDMSGLKSEVFTREFVVDTVNPTPLVITSHPQLVTNKKDATFEFMSTDDGTGIRYYWCSLDGIDFTVCNSPHTYKDLKDGYHNLYISASDYAGNYSGPTHFRWLIDTVAPTPVKITKAPSRLTNQMDAEFEFEATDALSGVYQYWCSLDGANYTVCQSPTYYSLLNPGSHRFLVLAQDRAGNRSAPTNYEWVFDNRPPKIRLTRVPPKYTNKTSAYFAFDVEAGGASVASVHCRVDQGMWSACTQTANYSDLGEGSHLFEIRADDKAGNSATATFDWVVDLTPPSVTITRGPDSVSNSKEADFEFDGRDNYALGSFECLLSPFNTYQPCQSPKAYKDLDSGEYSFNVRAIDRAGNVSDPATYHWRVKPYGHCYDIEIAAMLPTCLLVVDSFERKELMDSNQESFGWRKALLDNGRDVDIEILSDSVMGPVADGNRAAYFFGRAGSSVHTIYLVTKTFDLQGYDEVWVDFSYLTADLETGEYLSFDVCTATPEECGVGSVLTKEGLNSNHWLSLGEITGPAGRGLDGRNHTVNDWQKASMALDLQNYSSQHITFRFAVRMDEGFISNDHSKSMEDAVILDLVKISAR